MLIRDLLGICGTLLLNLFYGQIELRSFLKRIDILVLLLSINQSYLITRSLRGYTTISASFDAFSGPLPMQAQIRDCVVIVDIDNFVRRIATACYVFFDFDFF